MERPALEEIRAEHVALGQRIHQLGEMLQLRDREGSPEAWSASVLERLEEFDRALRAHFAFEERGGYFAEVLAAAPRLSEKAARLKAHHAEYRGQSAALLELAGKAAGAADWDAVHARCARLLVALREHEREENELVRESGASPGA
jgi:hypothetical protein